MSETIRPAVYPVDEDDCPSRLERAERDLAACRALLAELVAALGEAVAGERRVSVEHAAGVVAARWRDETMSEAWWGCGLRMPGKPWSRDQEIAIGFRREPTRADWELLQRVIAVVLDPQDDEPAANPQPAAPGTAE